MPATAVMGALLCHRALLLRVLLASNILLVHRCFSPLWVPLIQIGVLVATLVLLVVAMRVPTAFAGWLFRETLLVLAALKLGMFYLDLVVDNPVIQ